MKNLMALTLIVFSTSLYALDLDDGNNMGQEKAPKMRERSTVNDSISTGQSSTVRSRNSDRSILDTPAVVQPRERCIDRSGYSYDRNDSGFSSCVNQRSSTLK